MGTSLPHAGSKLQHSGYGSLSRNRTQAPCTGGSPLDHQRGPCFFLCKIFFVLYGSSQDFHFSLRVQKLHLIMSGVFSPSVLPWTYELFQSAVRNPSLVVFFSYYLVFSPSICRQGWWVCPQHLFSCGFLSVIYLSLAFPDTDSQPFSAGPQLHGLRMNKS